MATNLRAVVALAIAFATCSASAAVPDAAYGNSLACGLTAGGDVLIVNDSTLPLTAGSRLRIELGGDPLVVDLSDELLPGRVLLVAGAGETLPGVRCSAALALTSLVEV